MKKILGSQKSMVAERLLRNLVGPEATDDVLRTSVGYPIPLPVYGSTVYAVDGIVVPRMAGGVGFSTVADILAEAGTNGKLDRGEYSFNSAATHQSSWDMSSVIQGLGAAASALPGGNVPARNVAGALNQNNPGGTDTLHVVGHAYSAGSGTSGIIILYDRLWHGAITMSSIAAQSITGVPTRYTGTASQGNVAWVEVYTTNLAATAHNHTIVYVDNNGNTAETAPTLTGISSAAAGRIDMTQGWFMPLNGGDLGVRNLTSYTNSASMTGSLNAVIGRPLAMFPVVGSSAYTPRIADTIGSTFNLVQVLTDACLAVICGNSAPAHAGSFYFASG